MSIATSKNLLKTFLLLATLSVGPALGEIPESKPKKAGAVSAQAFADRKAVAPGDTITLAVELNTDTAWHIYWTSPGPGTGAPTIVNWKLPIGWTAGRTLFPVPLAKYDKELEETTYILEGKSVLITPVKVFDTARPGDTVTLTVNVDWLMCRKECIPGNAELSLSLPVVARGTKADPANAELFSRARDALPTPLDKAEHVKVAGAIADGPLKPGAKATATLTIDIEARHHMQSHTPSPGELIPAILFLENTPGLDIGDVEYPKGRDRVHKGLGKLSEYSGKIELKIPITVDEKTNNAPRWIRGVLQYQICTDAGTCFPPQHVQVTIPVQMAGGPAPTKDDPWLSAPSATAAPTAPTPPKSADGGSQPSSLTQLQNWLLSFGYFGALLVAFVGGLILNVMPCVLPVISLKILSFVRQSHEDRGRIFRLGLTYSAGILVFFGVLAAFFTLGGQGWGQLFQNPRVVLGLAAVVTAFAMSLFGVWALFTPQVINKLGEKAEGEGYSSAFFTGVLATFLGTACTAPFLSAALGAASRFNAVQGAGIFLCVGVGMALPFVLLAANPAWLKFVPRPGPWMSTFEAGMGFILLGTVVWLLNPLRGQLGDFGLLLSLIFLLAVAMAAWIKGMIKFGDDAARKAKLYSMAFLILVAGWSLPFRVFATIDGLIEEQIERLDLIDAGQRAISSEKVADLIDKPDWSKDKIQWKRYKRERAHATVKGGYTVFIDYTADWCANCKTMLKTAIETPETIAVMKALNIVAYSADYTLPVPEIKEDLARFQRGGVPVFVIYRPGDTAKPEILPEIITSQSLIDALKRAGESQPGIATAQ
ncbi:MAG: thioredoxin family protein [Planctomycetes bacterium]|nr:thioredoxin family protein [Planctomycetota bacterium]